MIFFGDTETFSEIPLSQGVHRYAEGSEILLSAWAQDDGAVRVEEGLHPEFTYGLKHADQIVFQNLPFDRRVLAAQGVTLPLERCHCTMARALAHSLPGGLGALCDVLGVPVDKAKDKEGRQWIQLFCKPRPKNSELRRATKVTHPEQWRKFVDYAGLDIEAMRECFKRLPMWNYRDAEHALWQLDQIVNNRGFAVDLDFAQAAIAAVTAEKDRLAERVQAMTDGEVQAATQRDAMLRHLLEQYGVTLPDMQKGTLERRLNDPDLPDAVRELLAIRLEASTTSTAKYKALINAASSDGRLRGGLQFCGAARTGRWSGKLFQPQNLPRPSHSYAEVEASIEAFTSGTADLLFPDVIARASSCIRSAIVAPDGKKLIAADLSNIEGRMLAWLAGEEWKLKAFAEFDAGIGHDLYILAYARAFGLNPDAVTKDQRQLGKVQELALGYQGAVGAFLSMAQLYGMDLPEDEVLRLVKSWRRANSKIRDFWYWLGDAAISATQNPGKTTYCGRLLLRRDGAWLRIQLPSGRFLCYPQPRVEKVREPCRECDGDGCVLPADATATATAFMPEDDPAAVRCVACGGSGWGRDKQQLTYAGVNQYTRKWERLRTYGGKLAENVTQAASRDVLAAAMPHVEAAGYEIVLTVHDEIVTEAPDDPAFSPEALSAILATNPPWASGLPLAAAGFEGARYRKD
jgi:DNA polymerase